MRLLSQKHLKLKNPVMPDPDLAPITWKCCLPWIPALLRQGSVQVAGMTRELAGMTRK